MKSLSAVIYGSIWYLLRIQDAMGKKYYLTETNQTEVNISWSARKKVIKDGPTGFTTLFRTRSLKVETSGVAPSGYQLMPAKREQRKFLEISRN